MIDRYLKRLNITELKPMQAEAINTIKNGTNVLLLSPTGSGKTLAFLLPLIQMIIVSKPGIQAMIITPSRELALQIEKVFKELQTGLKVNTCYGGHPITTELNNLTVAPSLLIGTPGRIADHLRRGSINTLTIRTLVLDEFDKSLELGFKDEMEYIIGKLESIETRVLTSATSLDEIPMFVKMTTPIVIDYTDADLDELKLTFKSLRAESSDKLDLLFRLLCKLGDEASVVFCNHREAVNRISELLSARAIAHGTFHGGMEQERRELSLIKFRNGANHVLLTTDLASRGLDIPQIRNVIHYQLPTSFNAWKHRNGRTARMEEHGTSWILLAENDYIPEFINQSIEEVLIEGDISLPNITPWETIYISAGRKDKISKGDIAGFLMQKGLLKKDELGKIEVLDFASYAAIDRNVLNILLKRIKGEQLKKKNVKIEIAY